MADPLSLQGSGPLVPRDEEKAKAIQITMTGQEEPVQSLPATGPLEPRVDNLTRNSVRAAEDNPDQVAADEDLARAIGIPPAAVADNTRPGLQKQATQQQIANTDTPVLRSLLGSDPLLPRLASDDIPSLTSSERIARELSFTGAFSGGVDLLQGQGWRFVEAGAEALGAEGIEATAQAAAEEAFTAAGEQGVKQRFLDIQTAGDFAQWMVQTGGEQIPLMAPALVGGIGGAIAGSAAGPVGTVVGGVLGAFIPSFILGVGETQQAIKERDVTVEAPGIAFGAGALIGLLDSALPGKVGTVLRKAFGRELAEQALQRIGIRILARNVAVEGGKGMALEGITEAIQEVISETASAAATKTKLGDISEQIIEAFAAGAFLGGGVTGAVEVVRARRVNKTLDKLDAEEKKSKLRQRASDKNAKVKVAQMQAAGVESIFVPRDVLLQYAQSTGDPVATLQALGVTGTLEGEGRVEIPLVNFTKEILGTPGYTALAKHLTVSRDARPIAEIAEEAFSDEEAEADYLADLEAYDAAEELKSRVEETIKKATADPKKAADVIDAAGRDVQVVLDALIQNVKERKVSTRTAEVTGRVAQLDEDIAKQDAAITQVEDELDAQRASKQRLSKQLGTVQLEAKLAKLIENRDAMVKEQSGLVEPTQEIEKLLTAPPVENGTITFSHHSALELTELDPAFEGTNEGIRGGKESRRSDPGYPARTYIGIAEDRPGGYRPEIGVGDKVTEGTINAEKLYDFDADPDGLRAQAEAAVVERRTEAGQVIQKNTGAFKGLVVSQYEALIKAAGFEGYWVASERGLVGALFGKVALREAGAAAIRGKTIKTKAKTLQDLGVRITSEAIRATRAAFKAGLGAGLGVGKKLVDAKRALVKEINANKGLTSEQQNVLNGRINSAKTVPQLQRIAGAIQSRAAVLVNKNRAKQIKKAIKKVLRKNKPKTMSGKLVGTDAAIEVMLARAREIISLKVETAKERLELLSSQDLFGTDAWKTSDFERTLLALAANDPEINVTAAENALIDLHEIINEGKAIAANRVLAKRNKIEAAVSEYKEATVQGTPTAELKTTGFFARLKAKGQDVRTALASMHNAWDEILDITINKAGVQADALIESLRMTKYVQKFKGRILKWDQELVDIGIKAFGLKGHAALTDRHHKDAARIDFGTFVNARGEKVRLEYSKAEIRKLWMEQEDPTIKDVTQHEDGNAFTDEMMRALVKELDQTDYAYAQAQLDFYKKIYPQVNAVYRRVYGIDLPFNEFYSPIQRDKGAVTQEGARDAFGTDRIISDEMTFRRTCARSLEERTPGIVPIMRRSDVGAMHRYLHDMAWFIETTEQVLYIKGVFDSQSLRKDIAANHGTSMLRFIDAFLEDFGPGYAARGTVAEQAINAINRRFSASVLAIKGTIGTKQLVSWFAMADNIPTVDFIAAHVDFFKLGALGGATSAKKIVKFLWENSAALRERGSSLDFEMAKIGSIQEPLFRWKKEQTMQNLFFSIIKLGDRLPIYAGGWAVYKHAIKQGKTHEQAIEAFEDAMETTQQSTDIDKMSAMQRAGAMGRTLTMFMTARMALLRGELRAFRQRPEGIGGSGKITYREFGKRMATYHFIMPMFIQFIASGFKWDEDRQLIAALLGQLNAFVIFGDILTLAVTDIVGEGQDITEAWRDSDLPLAAVTKEMWEGAEAAFSEETRADDMLEVVVELAGALGNFIGQPVDQVANIMGGVNDVLEGDVEKGLKRIWGFSEKVAEESSE